MYIVFLVVSTILFGEDSMKSVICWNVPCSTTINTLLRAESPTAAQSYRPQKHVWIEWQGHSSGHLFELFRSGYDRWTWLNPFKLFTTSEVFVKLARVLWRLHWLPLCPFAGRNCCGNGRNKSKLKVIQNMPHVMNVPYFCPNNTNHRVQRLKWSCVPDPSNYYLVVHDQRTWRYIPAVSIRPP